MIVVIREWGYLLKCFATEVNFHSLRKDTVK